jgi:molybdenum cofactor synthesis domain-containing protein
MGAATGEATAAVLLIGDELLSGKVDDENARFLIRELRDLGVSLRRIEIIADQVDTIAASVRWCAARFDHVFTSGGVGPTHDDKTMEGVARAFSQPIARNPHLAQRITDYFQAHHRGGGAQDDQLLERNLRMADLPAGAELMEPPNAADRQWPVVFVGNVCILPGVPELFRRKFTSIRERFRQSPFHLRTVFCSQEESAIAAHLDQVDADHPSVAIGSYPRFDGADYKVKITLESKDRAAVTQALERLLALLPRSGVVRVE